MHDSQPSVVPLTFNKPELAIRGKPFEVALELDGRANPDPGSIFEGLPGDLVRDRIQLADGFKAKLSGAGFRIDPSAAVEKRLSDMAPTVWQWEVTATQENDNGRLLLEVAAVGGKDDGEALLTKYYVIPVKVSLGGRISDAVAWLEPVYVLGATVMAGLGAALAWWGKYRRNA